MDEPPNVSQVGVRRAPLPGPRISIARMMSPDPGLYAALVVSTYHEPTDLGPGLEGNPEFIIETIVLRAEMHDVVRDLCYNTVYHNRGSAFFLQKGSN